MLKNNNDNDKLDRFGSRWASASQNLAEHPYLKNKKSMIDPELLSHFEVRLSENNLLYPLRTLTSEKPIQYQTINGSGDKRLHCLSGEQAVFQVFGCLDTAKRIVIAESLTKAAAIYQAINIEDNFVAVVNAVSSGGIVKCSRQFSQLYLVTIAADNDNHKPEKDAPQGILKQVFNVATELNLKVCTPIKGFKDWDDWYGTNDYAASEIWDSINAAKVLDAKPTVQNLTDWLTNNPTCSLLNEEPQKHQFLFEDFYIPKGKVTISPASNGTGKTQLLVQIALQAALGKCFMHESGGRCFFKPLKPYKVLILSFEDDRETFINRINSTIEHFPTLKKSPDTLEVISKNLEIIDLPSLTPDHLLTMADNKTNKVKPDQMYEQVIHLINDRGFDLVFIDPMHYTTSAAENDNNQQGQHIRYITNIAERTGAAIYCFAHTTDDNPLRIRGATSIADRARSVFKVATVDRLRTSGNKTCNSQAKSIIKQLPDKINFKNVLWFKMDKNSYGIEDSIPFILQRHANGVIAPMSLTSVKTITDDSIIIEYIASCKKGYASKPMIESELAGKLTITKTSIKNKLLAMVNKNIIFQAEYSEVNAAIKIQNNNTSWYRLPEDCDDGERSFSGF